MISTPNPKPETLNRALGVLWCDADVEELQFEGAVEDIKALKNHVDEQVV